MFKFALLIVVCIVLSVEVATCEDRITISQFLSFVDKITLLIRDARESVPKPNNLKPFKVGYIYETTDVRPLYATLPDSVKDLLKIFEPITTSTVTHTPSSTIATTFATKTPVPTTISSEAPSSVSSPSNTTVFSTESSSSPITIYSQTFSSTAIETFLSSESTSSTSESSSSSSESSSEGSSSSSENSSESSNTTPPKKARRRPSRTVHVYSDNNLKRSNKRGVSGNSVSWNELVAKNRWPWSNMLRTRRSTAQTDKEKNTEVINDLTRLATVWSPMIGVYKAKLRGFESILSGRHPLTFWERTKAMVLAKMALLAKPVLTRQTAQIYKKADAYRAAMKDPALMRTLMTVTRATAQLPTLLINSLLG